MGVGIGFPRDCGDINYEGNQWNSNTRGGRQHYRFSVLRSLPRSTTQGCTCAPMWKIDDLNKCDTACCNLDGDAGGDWCMVKDETCQGANWGYCSDTFVKPRDEWDWKLIASQDTTQAYFDKASKVTFLMNPDDPSAA